MSHSVKIYNTCIGCVRNVRIQNFKFINKSLILNLSVLLSYSINNKFRQFRLRYFVF